MIAGDEEYAAEAEAGHGLDDHAVYVGALVAAQIGFLGGGGVIVKFMAVKRPAQHVQIARAQLLNIRGIVRHEVVALGGRGGAALGDELFNIAQIGHALNVARVFRLLKNALHE